MKKHNGTYRLFVPSQAVGAGLVYFDLFNASGSNMTLLVKSVLPIVSGATAVTGLVAVDLFLTMTSAVGTGGTAATFHGTSLTAATISKSAAHAGALPGEITARLTPSGGATAGGVIAQVSLFTEETNGGTYLGNGANLLNRIDGDTIDVPQGHGIRVVQGAVASVGNIGFDVLFDAILLR